MNKKIVDQQVLTGERALFRGQNLLVKNSIFKDGESPLKESRDITLEHVEFKWKYPLWYAKDIVLKDSTIFEMGRAGIWYTDNITVEDTTVVAPKNFRKCHGVKLRNVSFPNAEETLWNCKDVELENVDINGHYIAMNSENMKLNNVTIIGNYGFDGAKNVEIQIGRAHV